MEKIEEEKVGKKREAELREMRVKIVGYFLQDALTDLAANETVQLQPSTLVSPS